MAKPEESSEDNPASTGLNTQEVVKLIGIFEPSISFLLLQLIKLSTASKRKPRWEGENPFLANWVEFPGEWCMFDKLIVYKLHSK